MSMNDKRTEVELFCRERMEEIADYCGVEDFKEYDICELHNDIFNTDYYIVGRYQAKQWLGADAFDCIGDVQEYEKFNFGKVHTDLSEPECVVNMWVYVYGWEIIEQCFEEVCETLDNQIEMDLA